MRQPGIDRSPRATTPRTNPAPAIPRQPAPIRNDSRPSPSPVTSRPGDSRITRPTNPIAPNPGTNVRTDTRPRTPGASDNVYRGREPSPGITRPGSRDTVRSPVATPRTPEAREPAARPRPTTSRVGRFAPSDTTPTTNVTARPRTPAATTTTRDRSPVASSTTPRLVPRTTSPRLTVPRSGTANGFTNGVTSPRSSSARSLVSGVRGGYASYGDHRGYDHGHRSYWRSWWDPCRHDSWSYWSWNGCSTSFGWSLSLWHPWSWMRTRHWNDCYFDSWHYNWSRPSCVATNYWWYPTSTYCPTYLYVPSTVVYVDTEREPLTDDGSSETVVAGGIAGGAGAVVPVGDIGSRGQPPESLAKKYVELGDFYFDAGRFPEAAEAYSRAKTYAPDNASVHFAMADAAFATGDYHFAAFLIAEAVRLQPTIVSAEIDRRVYYGDPKVFDGQMDELTAYLAAKPYDAQAHLVHGYNLRFSGKPTAAVAAFRRVLEIAPENRTAQAFLAVLAPAGAEATVR